MNEWREQALSQLCAFCSPDRRKESANLCNGDLSKVTVSLNSYRTPVAYRWVFVARSRKELRMRVAAAGNGWALGPLTERSFADEGPAPELIPSRTRFFKREMTSLQSGAFFVTRSTTPLSAASRRIA